MTDREKMTNDALRELAAKPVAVLPNPSERIRLREAFGVSQTKLAQTMGVSRRTIYGWEHGTVEPTGENRERYAQLIALWQENERESNRQTGKGN